MCCGDFRRQRPASDASRPVVAGTVIRNVDGGVVDDDRIRYRAVIDLNVGDVHIVDGTVIVETISVPVPALIADSDVAESIVNAAVVADMSAPIAMVIAVPTADKSPISRCPQIAHLRRPRPRAGHPVVTFRSIAPISGRPQIAIAGAVRLRIFRQRWRGLCGLHHWLAVAPILVACIVIVIRIVLLWRRLPIVLLRRPVCWLLLIVGTGRLGRVRRGSGGPRSGTMAVVRNRR